LSQSERDWMYAKRALARGDDPEELIREGIAQPNGGSALTEAVRTVMRQARCAQA